MQRFNLLVLIYQLLLGLGQSYSLKKANQAQLSKTLINILDVWNKNAYYGLFSFFFPENYNIIYSNNISGKHFLDS